MSTPVLVIGRSGSGKSASLRNLDPKRTLLIQPIKKPLPFKNDWKLWDSKTKTGSIVQTDNAEIIIKAIKNAPLAGKDIIIVDDNQYVMSNEFMRRTAERGYEKFTEIGKNAWDIVRAITESPSDARVYVLSHTQEDDGGKNVRMKTIGKMLDDKVCMEGMFTIVLKSFYYDGKYIFTTKTNGEDTVKTPMGMFDEPIIDNDLNEVDKVICEYYNIGEK